MYPSTPSTLFRIDQEYLYFYDSGFAMIEYISHERPDPEAILTGLHRPSVFVNLPLMNVQQALKRKRLAI
ncbi:MAG: hypothetical protein GY744_01125 [Gammaproteobacteria bacterium]|nr:hypothetical protein [Gammaproteobacteria bacterium]